MKLDSIYKILDKKDIINEGFKFFTLSERYAIMKDNGDMPIPFNKFKTKEDFIILCPVGSEFYIFRDNGEYHDIGIIETHSDKFNCIEYKEKESGVEWNFGYDGVLDYIRHGNFIPFYHINYNYDGDDSEIDD